MQKHLDCAVLAMDQNTWVDEVSGSYFNGRMDLRALHANRRDGADLFGDPTLVLGRYDACLLYVDKPTIGVWRAALSSLGTFPAALLAYVVDLPAGAIRDLLELGVTDFMSAPFCPEDLRARLNRALNRPRTVGLAETGPAYEPAELVGLTARLSEADLCDSILDRSGAELEAYAVALASRHATSRESFRTAKTQVIARFERAYICAALDRYGGNISLAARMAQKHRRAFWALMQKHDIDPEPFRAGGRRDRAAWRRAG